MLKNYDIRFPLLFAAACLFEVVVAAFRVWNSFIVVGYRMSGLMPRASCRFWLSHGRSSSARC